MRAVSAQFAPGGLLGKLGAACALVGALTLLAASIAQAHVVFLHGRPYGETFKPGVQTPGSVKRAAAVRAGRVSPSVTVGGPQPQLEYHGGPLMLKSKLYLIFWDPEAKFSAGYKEALSQYAHDLAADASLTTTELSVARLYKNASKEPISGEVTFGGEVLDKTPYPPIEEANGCTAAHAPCVTDAQIQSEIVNQIKAAIPEWPTDPASAPDAQYLLYTPKGVASCIEKNVCTFSNAEGFCAYHSQIAGLAGGRIATYSNLPDMPECDSGQSPAGVGAGGKDADGTLDSEIHEIVESATDPGGTAYFDELGEEIADKCTYPDVQTEAEAYGAPLGGSLIALTAFNQVLGGHTYYTQQMWSNEPTKTPAGGEPAGCVARSGPTPSFAAVPASDKTGQTIDFDAAGSYDVSEPIASYAWSFGDGSPTETTSSASTGHAFLTPGVHDVSLTVTDATGNADASTQTIPVTITGPAIGPPSATISEPADDQSYTLGQLVATSFSCADASGGPGIASCTDSAGSASPGALDTSAVGEHSYTVTARSLDASTTTATIHYTVTNPVGGGNASGGTGGGTVGSSGTTSTATGSASHARPASLTTAQKLARALKACRKLRGHRHKKCVAAARRRYGPAKSKHREPRRRS